MTLLHGLLIRLVRVWARARYHARRAASAVRRAGPGRSNGAVESARTSVAGVVHVTGWCYRSNEPIEAVVILVDGEPRTLAEARRGARGCGRRVQVRPGKRSCRLVGHGRARASRRGARVAIGAVAVTAAGLAERFDPVLGDIGTRNRLRLDRLGAHGVEEGFGFAPGRLPQRSPEQRRHRDQRCDRSGEVRELAS